MGKSTIQDSITGQGGFLYDLSSFLSFFLCFLGAKTSYSWFWFWFFIRLGLSRAVYGEVLLKMRSVPNLEAQHVSAGPVSFESWRTGLRGPLSLEVLAWGAGPTLTRYVGTELGGTGGGDGCNGVEVTSATPFPCWFERSATSSVTKRLSVGGSESGADTLR